MDKGIADPLLDDPLLASGEDENIAQQDDRDSDHEVDRNRKPTEKGKAYKIETLDRNRNSAYKRMAKQLDEILRSLESNDNLELLAAERDKLDILRENFNQAFKEFHDIMETEEQRQDSYQWFDVRDREYAQCRIKLTERIYALGRSHQPKSAKPASSVKSRISGASRSSKSSVRSRRIDAATKAAKLKVELGFLEQEAEQKKLQIMKEIALADAEEKTMKRFQEEEMAVQGIECKETRAVTAFNDDQAYEEKEDKPLVASLFMKKEPSFLDPYTPAFKPSPVSPEARSLGLSESNLKAFIDLQQRQTELSALIVNQQRISTLPVQEPPTFSGDFFDYPLFIRAFETIIETKVESDRDRLYFLNKYTSGKANDVIKGFVTLNSDHGYREARKLLAQRFGDPFHVAQAYKNKLRRWPHINEGDGPGIQELSDYLIRCREAMKTMRCMEELNSTETLIQISSKLPSYSGVRWCRTAHQLRIKKERAAIFQDLVEFVREEADLAMDPTFSPDVLKRERMKDIGRDKGSRKYPPTRPTLRANTLYTSSSSNPRSNSSVQAKRCLFCSSNHNLDECFDFKKLTIEDRLGFVRTKGLCFGCYGQGHRSKDCKKRIECKDCGKRHPTTLHQESKNKREAIGGGRSEESSQEGVHVVSNCANVSNSMVSDDREVNSMIVPVWLHHKDYPQAEVMVYALLDDASDTTFVRTSTLQALGIHGVDIKLNLSTMHGKAQISAQRIDGLVVKRLDKRVEIELPKTYSRDSIPSRRNQIPRPETASVWPHLRQIEDKIPPYKSGVEVGILIGCNCPRAIKPREVILGKGDDPYAIRTLLGWGILGPVTVGKDGVEGIEEDYMTCHRIVTQEVVSARIGSPCFVVPTQTKESLNPFQVERMFELDFSETTSGEPPLSQDEKRFMAKAEEGIRLGSDGHYEMPLPLKNPNVYLPKNREFALRRLVHLKKKFNADRSYRDHYVKFIEAMLKNGYAEKVPTDNSESNQRTWYIPHHGVYHPKKPNKIRVVFDCSATYKGESLNKHLLQGPDLTNSLTGVLCRFREETVAFMCDIEGMFMQVKVTEDCRDLLRFLWWDNGDTSKEPQVYRMTVHLFGAASSPGCANFALKTTAKENEEELGCGPAQCLRKNFYVDDGLKSVPSVVEAVELIQTIKTMCKKGGFNLHKFTSNKKEVIEQIPVEDRSEDIKFLDLDRDALPMERALGVQWCIESDSFTFRITVSDRPCTRRGILSTVSSIFDPLGFIAPYLLEGKKILQELCKDKTDWDETVPDHMKARWEKWRTELQDLEQFSIPRCHKPENFGNVVEVGLHHFSDASNKGYGQCSYLRFKNDKDQVHCAFVTGKARVTPLKPITIPRLELTAAVVSVRISEQLRRELPFKELKETFWTDSKVVLGYISNESRRFHIFVANRTQQIRDSTSVEQWRYVDTKSNPADEASRGLHAGDLADSKWIKGPWFLWKDESEWPVAQDLRTIALPQDDPEVKKSVTLATTTIAPESNLESPLEDFSDWYRAKRALALGLRFIHRLQERKRSNPVPQTTNSQQQAKQDTREARLKSQEEKLSVKDIIRTRYSPVKVEEIQQAEARIIKMIQARFFEAELKAFESTPTKLKPEEREFAKQRRLVMKSSSSLSKLDPFLDHDGILRVGGRLRRADLPNDVKFPAILPRASHITNLVIKHWHEQVKHQRRGITLNEIRSNGFWIVGGTSVVGSYISRCVTCKKLRGTVQEQKMADLPADRLEPAPPFTNCAVDYFGPWFVKEGRKEVKRYGVLFTCMASRAVHLETSNTMETDSFINALRRFICRRGPVRQLRSDQGTNFVGARRELKDALTELDQNKIGSELLKNNCDWIEFKMNVPCASHMGGVWERQIRSVRSVLSALLESNGSQLDDEALRTFMCEAEAIVNSRPLTVDALNDPDALTPLTPSNLLTMKSKIVLPPPGNFQAADLYSRKRWRRVQHLSNEFWCRWRKEFLQSLQSRSKWCTTRRNLRPGDVVIIKDDTQARNGWELARVVSVTESKDGHVRTARLAVADPTLDSRGKRTKPVKFLERPVQKLVLLMSSEDTGVADQGFIPVEEP